MPKVVARPAPVPPAAKAAPKPAPKVVPKAAPPPPVKDIVTVRRTRPKTPPPVAYRPPPKRECPLKTAAKHVLPTYMAGGVVAGKGAVVVELRKAAAPAGVELWYSTDNWRTKTRLGSDADAGKVDLGTFAGGTRIEFGITTADGELLRGRGADADGVRHVRGVVSGTDGVLFGFEDGGDRDYNDAMIRVRTRKTW